MFVSGKTTIKTLLTSLILFHSLSIYGHDISTHSKDMYYLSNQSQDFENANDIENIENITDIDLEDFVNINELDQEDTYSNYGKEIGGIYLTIAPEMIFLTTKHISLPDPEDSSKDLDVKKAKLNDLFKGVFGLSAKTSILINKFISINGSLFLSKYKIKEEELGKIYELYGNADVKMSKLKEDSIYPFGLNLGIDGHLAFSNNFVPYLGCGVYYSYFLNDIDHMLLAPSYGWFLSGGFDVVINDMFVAGFEVQKKFSMESKVTYKSSLFNRNRTISSKIKFEPLTCMLKIGLKF